MPTSPHHCEAIMSSELQIDARFQYLANTCLFLLTFLKSKHHPSIQAALLIVPKLNFPSSSIDPISISYPRLLHSVHVPLVLSSTVTPIARTHKQTNTHTHKATSINLKIFFNKLQMGI